jgi:demethylmenaquinone methyltransferase/2-methoxy-6-polyprenyl-1,4-benzoquinol methylase
MMRNPTMCLVDDVARYYSARAGEYDETAGYTDPMAEELREPVKALCRQALAGHDVLEVGCGTGYWTAVIAETTKSVLATDVNPSMVSIARNRLTNVENVQFDVADAYSLEPVPVGFTAAFAMWWWSHIPKPHIQVFLTALHRKLVPGGLVLIVDQLPSAYQAGNRRCDADGNWIEDRCLGDGTRFAVVKNFPSDQEIQCALKGVARNVTFMEYPDQHTWAVSYTVV